MHSMRLTALGAVAALFCSAILGACGDFSTGGSFGSPSAGGGNFGATTGGVKDMKLARELVKNGQVPPSSAFVVEGIFAEHDLPLDGAACTTLLCLRGATGFAPTLDGTPSGWAQIGLSSTINPETFQRPSLNAILLIDRSGSMGWDYSSSSGAYSTPGAIAVAAAQAIVARLGGGDRVAILGYDDRVYEELALTEATNRSAISAALESRHGGGSTNLTAGLKRAIEWARAAKYVGAPAQTRILLFTDEQPNTGGSDPASFEGMARAAAQEGIGLTVFGLGLGLGETLFKAMSHLPGGNAFSIMQPSEVEPLLAEHWPWMVSPIAYELSLQLLPLEGMTLADSYGFPRGTEPSSTLSASTVFLSKNRGALLVRLRAPTETFPATFRAAANLAYRTLSGELVQQTLTLVYPGGSLDARGQKFEQKATDKAVALAILVTGMRDAASAYATNRQGAVELMRKVAARAAADAQVLADSGFSADAELAQALLGLMEGGAPQGDLYGQR